MVLRALALSLVLAVVPAAQVRKLNGALAGIFDGDVKQFWTSPDSSWVYYTADQDTEGRFELYAAPSDGSAAAHKVNGELPAGGNVSFAFPSVDGARIAFLADEEGDGSMHLYVAPSDGSGPAMRLTTTAPVWVSSAVDLTATRAVFIGTDEGTLRLYSVLLDGSAAPVDVSGSFPEGFSLAASSFEATVAVSPDGNVVAYEARLSEGGFGASKVFRAPVDGSSPALEVASFSGSPAPATLSHRFSPDGTRILFVLLQASSSGLHAVPSDGSSAPVRLGSGTHPDYRFAPGGRVVFSDLSSLFSAPLDGSTPASLLASLGSPNSFVDFGIGGGRVAYIATSGGVREVYSVPLDASAAPLRLNAPFVSGGSAGHLFEVSPDGGLVLYNADAQTDGVDELYAVPIDGSASPVELSGVLVAGGGVVEMGAGSGPTAVFLPDGSRVVYAADGTSDDVYELFSAPVDGSTPPVKLSPSLGQGGDVSWSSSLAVEPVVLADGSRVVFHADAVNEVFELFSVAPIGGAVEKLNGPLLPGAVVGDVADFRYVPDGTQLVFRADGSTDEVRELHVVGVSSASPPRRLDPVPPGGSAEYSVLSDGSRVVLRTASSGHELFSAPLDGSAPMVRLDPLGLHNPLQRFAVAPAGGRVVFVTDPLTIQVFELFSVPADASAAPVRISGPMTTGGDVTDSVGGYAIAQDGARVVYRADQDVDEVFELYSAPTDGSGPAVELSGTLVAGGDVSTGFQLDAGGSRVVFLADALADTVIELFSAPLDGSAAPVRLSGSMVSGGDVSHFVLSPDGTRLVFRADRLVNDRFELFSAPLDGSADPVTLSGALIATGDVSVELALAPDGSRVAYRADALVEAVVELFAAPLDGSAAPVRLNAPLASGVVSSDYRFAGTGRVLYRAEQLTAGVQELFRVPSDGSAAPVRLDGPLVSGGDVLAFAVSPDGSRVLYLADQLQDGVNELFQREIVGGPARRASGALAPGGQVFAFAFSPNGRSYSYLADADAPGVVELWLGHLPEPKLRRR